MNKEPITIKDYDYVEFGLEHNKHGQTILAIYGIDNETLEQLQVGSVVKWDNERQDELNGFSDEPIVWNGEVYGFFTDFVLVYLY
jgi:hypothetical protein